MAGALCVTGFRSMKPVLDPTVSLKRRSPESRLDWLTEQVSLLVAQRGQMQREINTLRERVEHLERNQMT